MINQFGLICVKDMKRFVLFDVVFVYRKSSEAQRELLY